MVWFFDRGVEQLACEVRRAGEAYEVVVRSDEATSVTQLDTPEALLKEIVAVPRSLIVEGWRPRTFDPLAVPVDRQAKLLA